MVILEILTNLPIIAASFVAIYGIGSRRKGLKGKKQFYIAEQVLSLFYACRDKIRIMRSPLSLDTNFE